MLLFATAALLMLLRERWFLAGVCGIAATATRANALALVLAAGIGSLAALRERRALRSLLAPLLTPLGYVGFVCYLKFRTGAWDAYTRTQQEGWNQHVNPLAMITVLRRFHRTDFSDVNVTFLVVGLPVAVALLVLLVRTHPPLPLLAYTVGILGFCLIAVDLGTRPRFILTAFPLLYGIARRPMLHRFLAPTLAMFGGVLTLIVIVTQLHTP